MTIELLFSRWNGIDNLLSLHALFASFLHLPICLTLAFLSLISAFRLSLTYWKKSCWVKAESRMSFLWVDPIPWGLGKNLAWSNIIIFSICLLSWFYFYYFSVILKWFTQWNFISDYILKTDKCNHENFFGYPRFCIIIPPDKTAYTVYFGLPCVLGSCVKVGYFHACLLIDC